jgi:hypothetical protein
MRKCLKVEYLGRIEYHFQKSCVTGPWDHKFSVSAIKFTKKFHACVPFKGPKHEILVAGIVTQSRPVWISDLGTRSMFKVFMNGTLYLPIYQRNFFLVLSAKAF